MSNKDVYILGIESSCDDTSAAVLKNDTVLSNKIANKSIHKKYGETKAQLLVNLLLQKAMQLLLDNLQQIKELKLYEEAQMDTIFDNVYKLFIDKGTKSLLYFHPPITTNSSRKIINPTIEPTDILLIKPFLLTFLKELFLFLFR